MPFGPVTAALSDRVGPQDRHQVDAPDQVPDARSAIAQVRCGTVGAGCAA